MISWIVREIDRADSQNGRKPNPKISGRKVFYNRPELYRLKLCSPIIRNLSENQNNVTSRNANYESALSIYNYLDIEFVQ